MEPLLDWIENLDLFIDIAKLEYQNSQKSYFWCICDKNIWIVKIRPNEKRKKRERKDKKKVKLLDNFENICCVLTQDLRFSGVLTLHVALWDTTEMILNFLNFFIKYLTKKMQLTSFFGASWSKRLSFPMEKRTKFFGWMPLTSELEIAADNSMWLTYPSHLE